MEELSSILEELKEKMPLLEEVANPTLQPRHWNDIHGLLGTLEEFCPVEVERRERIEAAKATGEAADVSDLVSPTCRPCLASALSRSCAILHVSYSGVFRASRNWWPSGKVLKLCCLKPWVGQ